MPMAKVSIYKDSRYIMDGVLIEDRTYCRTADLLKGLGYAYDWFGEVGGGKLIIRGEVLWPEQDIDLRLPSMAEMSLLDAYVKDTPLAGLGKAWLEAEANWRVNAIFLCALACHESDFGRSKIAREKKNLYGFMAYDDSPYASAKSYGTYRGSIADVCRLLVESYLFPSGKYYNGPTPAGINIRYASDKGWAGKVVNHMAGIVKKK